MQSPTFLCLFNVVKRNLIIGSLESVLLCTPWNTSGLNGIFIEAGISAPDVRGFTLLAPNTQRRKCATQPGSSCLFQPLQSENRTDKPSGTTSEATVHTHKGTHTYQHRPQGEGTLVP